jgi:hypothetical protein
MTATSHSKKPARDSRVGGLDVTNGVRWLVRHTGHGHRHAMCVMNMAVMKVCELHEI